jgi:anti-sigma B factor antagonist
VADLGLETRTEGAVAHLILSGEFDLAGVQVFEARLAEVEAREPRAIVVDLSAVEFMDSSGLRALVTGDERSRQAGKRFAIVPGPPQVRRVFEITQLEERLDLVDDAAAVSPG